MHMEMHACGGDSPVEGLPALPLSSVPAVMTGSRILTLAMPRRFAMRNKLNLLSFWIIFLACSAALSSKVWAGDFHTPPYKLGRHFSTPYTHLQLGNDRRGLAIRVQTPNLALAYAIDPGGHATQLARIDGSIESIQVNSGHDRSCIHVKDANGKTSQWYLSTTGKIWVFRRPIAEFMELDSLPDGKLLFAEKLADGIALQLLSADGDALSRMVMPGAAFNIDDGDSAAQPLGRFSLLQDGSGVVERGPPTRIDGSTKSAIVVHFWGGGTRTSWIPGVILDHRGFDRDRIYVQTEGDRLFVTAAGGTPKPVELHGQAVRGLVWAGDGTLRMVHGNADFAAESYLYANGSAKAQWVRPRISKMPGNRGSVLARQLAQLDRAGALSGQTRWSGSVRASFLSDASSDAAAVVVLDGAAAFSPRIYAWPDDVVYSPDMRWTLRTDSSNRYEIGPAKALDNADAVMHLGRFLP